MGINTAYTGDLFCFCFVCRADRFEITGVTVNILTFLLTTYIQLDHVYLIMFRWTFLCRYGITMRVN